MVGRTALVLLWVAQGALQAQVSALVRALERQLVEQPVEQLPGERRLEVAGLERPTSLLELASAQVSGQVALRLEHR